MARGWPPLSSAFLLSFSGVCFVLLFPSCFHALVGWLELCRCSSDVTFSCPADHVLNWQTRILQRIVYR